MDRYVATVAEVTRGQGHHFNRQPRWTMVGRSNMNWKQKIIDPKDKTGAVNSSWGNLGNHILIAGFIGFITFVIYASY